MTFIPRILASASNAPKQSHCQTGKSLAVYKLSIVVCTVYTNFTIGGKVPELCGTL